MLKKNSANPENKNQPNAPFDGLRFENLPNPDIKKATRKTYLSFIWRMIGYNREIVEIPDGHVIDQSTAAIQMRKLQKTDDDCLTWLGQACFLIRLNGKTILTDPYLSSHASPSTLAGPKRFVPPGLKLEDIPPIDYLVLSHNHYDHLDARTIRALQGKADITVIVPLRLGGYFKKRGFGRVIEMDWWDCFEENGITIHALPSQHWSKRTAFDRNKTLWASFSFKTQKTSLYFTGDTGYAPLFKDIGRDYGPFDYTLVGIGAYEPRAIMKAHHTTPEEAVDIAQDVTAKTMIAMHWGTVRLTDEPLFEPPGRFLQAAANAGYDAENTWIMSIGESRTLAKENALPAD